MKKNITFLSQTDRFVRTYKRNLLLDKVLCAIKPIIKSAIRQRRIRQLCILLFDFYFFKLTKGQFEFLSY
jgi:hypothetical protein